jgi:hypothetical protein
MLRPHDPLRDEELAEGNATRTASLEVSLHRLVVDPGWFSEEPREPRRETPRRGSAHPSGLDVDRATKDGLFAKHDELTDVARSEPIDERTEIDDVS